MVAAIPIRRATMRNTPLNGTTPPTSFANGGAPSTPANQFGTQVATGTDQPSTTATDPNDLPTDGNNSPETAPSQDNNIENNLAGYIKNCYQESKDFRQRMGINEDLLKALRAVRGEYDPGTQADIERYGGSKIYARISANKVRSVAAMLREIFTSADRPWTLSPTSDPVLQGETVDQAVMDVLKAEVLQVAAAGGQITPAQVQARKLQLKEMIMSERSKAAIDSARIREDQVDEFLQEGGYYTALWDFLLDIATFPFAVMKGPVVRYRNRLVWEGKQATVKNEPVMQWERCSPFDTYFAPWSRDPQDGYIIHFQRTTRSELQSLIGLPSYNADAIEEVLSMDADSFKTWHDYVETVRADLEDRLPDNWYSPSHAVDRPYPMIEFHGPVSGAMLINWGMSKDDVPDVTKDLEIVAYLIGDYVIGVRLNPHPLGRKPFYVDSFERVPGSVYGLGVPGLIDDIQLGGNACLRALCNNLAISSGPQVSINSDRLPEEQTDLSVYPWKVWSFSESMYGNANQTKPIEFFQPDSNAQELLGVYQAFLTMADQFSSLPRYAEGQMQGNSTLGRTSSGMSMMMNAANRTIKQTVLSIDQNIVQKSVQDLNVYLSLLRPDIVNDGDIDVIARGANELVERETLRMRRMEFLQITMNPTDFQLVGPKGRLAILKEIARDVALPLQDIFTGGLSPYPPPQLGINPADGTQVPGQAIPGSGGGMPPNRDQGPGPAGPTMGGGGGGSMPSVSTPTGGNNNPTTGISTGPG